MFWNPEVHKPRTPQGRIDNQETQGCPFRRGEHFMWSSKRLRFIFDCRDKRHVGKGIGVVIRVTGGVVVKEVLESRSPYRLVVTGCKGYQLWQRRIPAQTKLEEEFSYEHMSVKSCLRRGMRMTFFRTASPLRMGSPINDGQLQLPEDIEGLV